MQAGPSRAARKAAVLEPASRNGHERQIAAMVMHRDPLTHLCQPGPIQLDGENRDVTASLRDDLAPGIGDQGMAESTPDLPVWRGI